MASDTGRKSTLLLVACLTVMAAATIAPALPRMADAYRDVAHVELVTKLVLTAPALAIGLCAPLAGAIIDRFGRLALLRGSLALYGLAGAAGYVLHDLNVILASRFALGVAVAGTMTTMTALVGDYYSGEARGRFASLQSIAMSIGAMAFVVLGGVLVDLDWRLPFLLYLSGWAVLVPAALYLHEPHRGATTEGERGDASRLAIGRVVAAYAITFFAVAMFYMTPAQLPFLMRTIGVDSGVAAGIAVGTSSLLAAAGSAAFPRFRRFTGVLGTYAWAFAFMASGYALVGSTSSFALMLAGVVISGVGVGLFFPNGTLWVLTLAPSRLRGRIVGGLTAAIFLAQFASPLLTEPVVARTSLGGAFLVAAGTMATLAVALALLGRRG
ncbi:MAG TPA: MFS transporter [Burkholderiales bacterium]|nr:MFS transporter [Burkholderiales bacterium]